MLDHLASAKKSQLAIVTAISSGDLSTGIDEVLVSISLKNNMAGHPVRVSNFLSR